ncbi:carboxymuconolactone decarboxylase family protein [Paracoccus zhejiangensis]|uniref:Carboxymuconolactone decarboxylase family protein n=1 Tax=Paracoccus zhejiangensis TaxID=1077935 RepID=A0A2H5F3T7_9RHOB|nr:carboxymuconolactone decarboxylase family protein [Paracoccus zhejiangensis]AUH66209.1 carboxymuconolactone decarboxylase family protein [Paracoccus zhejiangensis]
MVKEFQPLGDNDWPESVADLKGGFATRLNVYRTMAHHPALLASWAPLRQHVVLDRALTDQQSEVVILRTGHNLQAPYEWAHHVSRGRAVGMEDARIAALTGPLEGIGDGDRILARAVDELMENARLLPSTRADLLAAVGSEGMFDLMATVGFYSVLGFIVNSCETPVDDDVAAELARRPAP